MIRICSPGTVANPKPPMSTSETTVSTGSRGQREHHQHDGEHRRARRARVTGTDRSAALPPTSCRRRARRRRAPAATAPSPGEAGDLGERVGDVGEGAEHAAEAEHRDEQRQPHLAGPERAELAAQARGRRRDTGWRRHEGRDADQRDRRRSTVIAQNVERQPNCWPSSVPNGTPSTLAVVRPVNMIAMAPALLLRAPGWRRPPSRCRRTRRGSSAATMRPTSCTS